MPNIGFKHSEESKEKIRKKLTGYKRSKEEIEKSRLKRIGFRHSVEAKKKMSKAHAGRIVTEETREKLRDANKGRKANSKFIEFISRKGSKNHNYKSEKAKYGSKHIGIAKLKGKEKKCEHCGTETAKRYEWSNKDHKYSRNPDDYQRLCCSCHYKYDVENNLRPVSYFNK